VVLVWVGVVGSGLKGDAVLRLVVRWECGRMYTYGGCFGECRLGWLGIGWGWGMLMLVTVGVGGGWVVVGDSVLV